MKNFAKVLSLVLALCMICSVAFAANDQRPVGDAEAYYAESTEIYNLILGEFNDVYAEAKEAETIAERYAKMAVAEAKLLESGIFIPLTSNGGNYAISRIAPYTITSVLWGNDSYRYHQAVIANEPLTVVQRDEMKAKWAELRGTGTYEAWAKEFLTTNGYTLIDTYGIGYSSDPKTWDVLATSRAADSEAIINTYDGLYEYDIENVPQPALATGFTVSEDGTKYTYTLREGVVWVDSQGRVVADVKADDFVAGMQHMLDAAGGLEYLVGADGCNIVGADDYINGVTSDFETVGVKALDDLTLEYTLAAPSPFFTTMLGYGVFAPMSREYYVSMGGKFGAEFSAEAESYLYGKDPDHIAYCGPYLVTNNTAENTIVFTANEKYWNADAVNVKTISWLFNDGNDPLKPYNDMKAGILAGCGLNANALEVARQEGLFDTLGYVSLTDATSFMGFVNVNRHQFVNFNDETKAVSPVTAEDAARTHAAMLNKNFRQAFVMSLDRATYNAQSVGEDLKNNSLINTYTPGNFVFIDADVTLDINGEAVTFPAGTMYGEIMQAVLVADGCSMVVWDPANITSSGFDGWYQPEEAAKLMAAAVEELAAEGVVVDADHPIYIDLPFWTSNTTYVNRSEVLKQSVEASLGGLVIVNKIPCDTAAEWYYAGYYPDYGYEMNADIMDVSGWGPDYGDPQTYLDTMLPDYAGYMVKSLGVF